jgi:hypothetical protein
MGSEVGLGGQVGQAVQAAQALSDLEGAAALVDLVRSLHSQAAIL